MEHLNKTCFGGDCKWRKQGANCVHCYHPNAIEYKTLTKPCETCGRNPGVNKHGCGSCIGRGIYVYPYAYEQCDCNGYEPK